jgi:hypothetical protein
MLYIFLSPSLHPSIPLSLARSLPPTFARSLTPPPHTHRFQDSCNQQFPLLRNTAKSVCQPQSASTLKRLSPQTPEYAERLLSLLFRRGSVFFCHCTPSTQPSCTHRQS